MGLIFKDADSKPVDPKTARVRAVLLSLPIAIIGLLALVLLVHDGLLGGLDRQKAMGLLSAAVVCGGLIMLIFGISAKQQSLQAGAAKTADEKPWLTRKEWAGGRIASSARKAVLLLWIFVAFWCLASAAICLAVVPPQLQQGNHAALIALIFPVLGLAIVFFALNTTRAWRKFNRSVFAMAPFPAGTGGTLAGQIQVRSTLQPRHGWHMRLSCVRRTMTGAANNRQATERVLWQDEKWLRSDLPQTSRNATGIPVFFKLPGDLPEASAAPGDGIHWKLEASAKLRGPDFHAVFELPVFKLPETPAPSDDPTVPYQMSLDEIRQQIRSFVQVRDLSEAGKEFIFPAARSPGFASGATLVCLIWTGIIALLIWRHAPWLFPLVLSAIDLLMAAFVLDLWFRRSRVTVNAKGMTVQRAWLAFKQDQRFQTSDIRNITSEAGAVAGHAAYHDLKVYTRDGREFVLAKNLDHKPEADWLAREMMAALGTAEK